jgi:single-strand DNA-binding protein
MINSVVLVGRLVADPETRYTQTGIAVCNFCIAVDRNFKNASGEKETDFINIVAWRKTAELCGQYLSKGRLVGIEGSLQIRKYQDKEGNNRTAAEVVAGQVQFLEPKRDGGGGGAPAAKPAQRAPQSSPGSYEGGMPEPPPDNMMDDDLPF